MSLAHQVFFLYMVKFTSGFLFTHLNVSPDLMAMSILNHYTNIIKSEEEQAVKDIRSRRELCVRSFIHNCDTISALSISSSVMPIGGGGGRDKSLACKLLLVAFYKIQSNLASMSKQIYPYFN